MTNTDHTELIDKFLNGELKGEALVKFKQHLAADPELRNEIQIEKEIDSAIRDSEVLEFRKAVRKIRAQQKERMNNSGLKSNVNDKSVIQIFKVYGFAAMIIMLIGIGSVLIYQSSRKPLNDRIFDRYYKVYPSDFINRSDGNKSEFAEAMKEYAAGNYKDAIVDLKTIIEKQADNDPVLFFLGIAYIETAEYKDAAKCFNQILENPASLFYQQSRWYAFSRYLSPK